MVPQDIKNGQHKKGQKQQTLKCSEYTNRTRLCLCTIKQTNKKWTDSLWMINIIHIIVFSMWNCVKWTRGKFFLYPCGKWKCLVSPRTWLIRALQYLPSTHQHSSRQHLWHALGSYWSTPHKYFALLIRTDLNTHWIFTEIVCKKCAESSAMKAYKFDHLFTLFPFHCCSKLAWFTARITTKSLLNVLYMSKPTTLITSCSRNCLCQLQHASPFQHMGNALQFVT